MHVPDQLVSQVMALPPDARAELLEVESANTAFNDVVQARPINVERESATEENAARRK